MHNSDHDLLSCSAVTQVEEFLAIKETWNRLADTNPMQSWDWLYSWWNEFQADNELMILVVRDSTGAIVGIAPWYKTISASGARVIRGLGDGTACSDYVSILCQQDDRERVEKCVAKAIFDSPSVRNVFSRWDVIEIHGHQPNAFDSFFKHMEDHSCTVSKHEIGGSWVTELPNSFSEFEATLTKSFRRKIKKARKSQERDDVSFQTIDRRDLLDENWNSFCTLHELRRASLGEKGCFHDHRFTSFLRNACLRLIDRERCTLGMMKVQGRFVGAGLILHSPTKRWMYQSGMDPFYKQWEPGHFVATGLVQNAITQGCVAFDFLRGDEPYKQRWNAKRIPLYKTRVVAPNRTAKFRHNLWLAGRVSKRMVVG